MNKYVIIFYEIENGKNLYIGHAIVTSEFKAKQVKLLKFDTLIEKYENFSQWQANVDTHSYKQEFYVFYNENFKIHFKNLEALKMFLEAISY